MTQLPLVSTKRPRLKISVTEYSSNKYNEQSALNNFKKELIVEIKQRLSSTECSKTSENNSVYVYIASTRNPVTERWYFFLRQELWEQNVPTKCKCITATADDAHLEFWLSTLIIIIENLNNKLYSIITLMIKLNILKWQ